MQACLRLGAYFLFEDLGIPIRLGINWFEIDFIDRVFDLIGETEVVSLQEKDIRKVKAKLYRVYFFSSKMFE